MHVALVALVGSVAIFHMEYLWTAARNPYADKTNHMMRTALATAALILSHLTLPAMAEIVPARCRLVKYDTTTLEADNFDCQFRQSGGNAQVWSDRWKFDFPAKDQGVNFIRINSEPLVFTRTGKYSLWVMQ